MPCTDNQNLMCWKSSFYLYAFFILMLKKMGHYMFFFSFYFIILVCVFESNIDILECLISHTYFLILFTFLFYNTKIPWHIIILSSYNYKSMSKFPFYIILFFSAFFILWRSKFVPFFMFFPLPCINIKFFN